MLRELLPPFQIIRLERIFKLLGIITPFLFVVPSPRMQSFLILSYAVLVAVSLLASPINRYGGSSFSLSHLFHAYETIGPCIS
jgi:hypothetical protein